MKQFVVLSLVLLFPFYLSYAQDTVYYFGGDYSPVSGIEQARFMKRVTKKSPYISIVKNFSREDSIWKDEPVLKVKTVGDGLQVIKVRDKFLDPKVVRRSYKVISPGLYSFKEYDNKLIREGRATNLIPLIPDDTLREYYPSGRIKTIAVYRNNHMISNQNWLQDGSAYIDNIYYAADQTPEYMKGNAYFRSFILGGLKNSGLDLTQIDDQVILGWVITEDGELTGAHVVYGKYRELNQFMVNLVSSLPGNWAPATLGGEKVRYYMTIPFNFGQSKASFDYLQLNNIGQLDWY